MNMTSDLLKTMPKLPPLDMGDGVTSPDKFRPVNAFKTGTRQVRAFDTGATRDQDTTKYDYEGFLSPLALRRFAAYMHVHRVQSDGSLRDSDNWQKGIPCDSYMKSLWRHLMTVWGWHRYVPTSYCESMEEALCGVIFNAQGYLHEIIKAEREDE